MEREVAAAARATLASASARVWSCRFTVPPVRDGAWTTEEGVTDFAARRTETSRFHSSFAEELARRVVARYPWLDDAEDGDAQPYTTVYAGTAMFGGAGDGWTAFGDGDPMSPLRGLADPAWIVEALRYAEDTVARGSEPVRGTACRGIGFRVDVAAHAVLWPVTRGIARRPRPLAGDAWIDAERRLRRVTWTHDAADRAPRAWRTTELWDFGVAVDIRLPVPEPASPLPVALAQLAWALWRRRRAYARRAG